MINTTCYTFKRYQRLLTSIDFKRVFEQVDIKAGTGQLLVLAFDTKENKPGRLGLVVAKKNLKRAVDRNRFKRVVKESFRENQHQLQGLDIVVLSRRGALDLDSSALKKVVDQTWQRINKKRVTSDTSVDT